MSPASRLPARFAGGLALLLAHVAPAQPSATSAPIDLPTALRLAGSANLEVRLAQEKIAEARAASDLVRNRFLPWITPSVSIRRHEENVQAVNGPVFSADKQSLAAGLAVQAQLELGEVYFQNLISRQQVRATEAVAAVRQREMTLRAATGYFELLRARAAVAAAEESAAILDRHARQAAVLGETGLGFRGDVARLAAARDRASLTVARLQGDQRIAAARLAETLRLDPAVDLTPADATLEPLRLLDPGDSPAPFIATALARRPELDEATARREAARLARRGAEVAPLVPAIGAQAALGGLGGGPAGSRLTRDWGFSGDFALGLSWRIGPGGLFDPHREREASARERQAGLAQELLQDAVRRQVVEQHVRVRSLARQLDLARTALASADTTARLSRQRRESGVSAALEDLQAEEELVRARRDYVGVIAEYNQAQYTLRFAAGE
jgi:outer membrane protein TolC